MTSPHGHYSKARYGADRFVRVGSYRIHYVEAGTGYPLLLVPGAFSTYRSWNRVMPLLSDHYRVLALDYLGTGDSDKPARGFRYTVEEQSHLIAETIETLGLGKVNLAGVSYGGAIVFYLAAIYPDLVNRMVSIEGGVTRPERLPFLSSLECILKYPVIGDLLLAIGKTGLLDRFFIRLMAGDWYRRMTPDDKKELLEQLRYNIKSASRIPWYRMSIAHKSSRGFEEKAQSIRAPALYLYGEKSDFKETLLDANTSFFQTYLSNVRVVGLEGGIHNLETQRPSEVAALILDFLG